MGLYVTSGDHRTIGYLRSGLRSGPSRSSVYRRVMAREGTEPDPRFQIRVDDLGVVRVVWTLGVHIDRGAALNGVRAIDELNVGRPRPLLVDMTGTLHVDREAREVFSNSMPSVSRLALVGRSYVDRVLAHFALGIKGTPIPRKFFTSESAAIEWLLDVRFPTELLDVGETKAWRHRGARRPTAGPDPG